MLFFFSLGIGSSASQTLIQGLARAGGGAHAMLTDEEADGVAWHRVVGQDGLLNATKHRPLSTQRVLLEAEGIGVSDKGQVEEFDRVEFTFS